MLSLKARALALIREVPGLTDRELTDRLLGPSAAPQAVNQVARGLASAGLISRQARHDGKLGNYPQDKSYGAELLPHLPPFAGPPHDSSTLSEDEVKRCVQSWLEVGGWSVEVKWGQERGIDVDAQRGGERWVIEAKGCGSRTEMRVNYFIAMLGETLQRMNDPDARYSVALPDMQQFRRLWSRLPALAKSRTQITALFVASSGAVEEVS